MIRATLIIAAKACSKRTTAQDVMMEQSLASLAILEIASGFMPEMTDITILLTNCAQILDVVKQEWGDAWSEWDQNIRDQITGALAAMPPAADHSALIRELRDALAKADQFIGNGIETGFIRMPTRNDPALETPGIVDAALRKANEALGEKI